MTIAIFKSMEIIPLPKGLTPPSHHRLYTGVFFHGRESFWAFCLQYPGLDPSLFNCYSWQNLGLKM